MTDRQCVECGARYTSDDDSCHARFEILLALDHSRQEPWGSRHGQAFAAFVLEHPTAYATSLDAAWELLYRIYSLGEAAPTVIASLRRDAGRPRSGGGVPPRPRTQTSLPRVTIADLSGFAAATYPSQLNAWCEAALASWSAASLRPPRVSNWHGS
jgi:Family of unknown function (DUF5946)